MMIDDANIWRFNVAGSKEVRDYRVKGNYVCDNTQSGAGAGTKSPGDCVCARQKCAERPAKTARWCPAFSTRMNGGWIWWLSSVNGNNQPWRVQYVLDEMLREIRHQLAQSQQLRPEQAAESED
ncbi:LysR family transcriptional regulator [Escherichia coli]|uniref:LysR family transcriptional regulator n=1 Tax=Escherichia coli TaxID=562 RepID=A0A376TYF3_ECOLX|nr:LysR family transcriptional regulator [Escherichia coli]